MKRSKTPAPRGLTWLAWGSLVAAVVTLFGVWPLFGSDLPMWLTVGRWTWAQGWPPMIDVWTYTTPGAEFVAHSWLAGTIFYLVESYAGTLGFMLLRLALVGTALLFAVKTARRLNAPWSGIVLLAPVVLAIMWARLEFRPQLFTTALLSCELWLLVSVHTGGRSWVWLWTLPPLYALWINLHAGWPQGIAMLGVVAIGVGAMAHRARWLGHGTSSALKPWHLPVVLLACGLALLVNPYGVRLLYFPLEMQADWIRDVFTEWASPWANEGWRDVGGGEFLSLAPVFFAYWLLLASLLVVTLWRWSTADLMRGAILAMWGLFSLWHLRAVSDATLLTSPLVAAGLASPLGPPRRWPRWLGMSGSLGLAIGVTWLLGMWWLGMGMPWEVWTWRRLEPAPLIAAVDHLSNRLGRPVRVFILGPELNYWLVYQLPGRVQVEWIWEFVTGREAWARIQAVHGGRLGLQPYLNRYGVDLIALEFRDGQNLPLLRRLGWVLVHVDAPHLALMREEAARALDLPIVPWERLFGPPPTPRPTEEVEDLVDRFLELLQEDRQP